MSLKGTKTEENLKAAFAGESQANRRYLYFAQKADVEGYNDVATVFRSTAEGETGHAHGHLEFLEETGDPATGQPIGGTPDNLMYHSSYYSLNSVSTISLRVTICEFDILSKPLNVLNTQPLRRYGT